ncbi:MAG: hypothetical protein GF349_05075, partial [Candidatus Magasanikbacteria bacterium]|nr:hypothetical protein [Candidatus Magasanikbacteria bacterium]
MRLHIFNVLFVIIILFINTGCEGNSDTRNLIDGNTTDNNTEVDDQIDTNIQEVTDTLETSDVYDTHNTDLSDKFETEEDLTTDSEIVETELTDTVDTSIDTTELRETSYPDSEISDLPSEIDEVNDSTEEEYIPVCEDSDGDSYPGTGPDCEPWAENFDCHDENNLIHPEALELCDEVDNNCNNITDEGCDCDPGEERDCGDPEEYCEPGVQTCNESGHWQGDCVGGLPRWPERCDNQDNDCDGE